MKNQLTRFFKEEEGLATIEIVLILVILAGIAFLFKGAIQKFFNSIKGAIETQIEQINTPMTPEGN